MCIISPLYNRKSSITFLDIINIVLSGAIYKCSFIYWYTGKGDIRKLMNLVNEAQTKKNDPESVSDKDIDNIISSLWKVIFCSFWKFGFVLYQINVL